MEPAVVDVLNKLIETLNKLKEDTKGPNKYDDDTKKHRDDNGYSNKVSNLTPSEKKHTEQVAKIFENVLGLDKLVSTDSKKSEKNNNKILTKMAKQSTKVLVVGFSTVALDQLSSITSSTNKQSLNSVKKNKNGEQNETGGKSSGILSKILGAFGSGGTAAVGSVIPLVLTLAGIGLGIAGLLFALSKFGDPQTISKYFGVLQDFAEMCINVLGVLFTKAVEVLKPAVEGTIDIFKNIVEGIINLFKNPNLKTAIDIIRETIIGTINDILSIFKRQDMGAVVEGIKTFIFGFVDILKYAGSVLIDLIKQGLDKVLEITSNIPSALKKFEILDGNKLIEVGKGVAALGGALAVWAIGSTVSSISGIISGISSFFGLDPTEKFKKFAEIGPQLKFAAGAIAQMTESLIKIDQGKVKAFSETIVTIAKTVMPALTAVFEKDSKIIDRVKLFASSLSLMGTALKDSLVDINATAAEGFAKAISSTADSLSKLSSFFSTSFFGTKSTDQIKLFNNFIHDLGISISAAAKMIDKDQALLLKFSVNTVFDVLQNIQTQFKTGVWKGITDAFNITETQQTTFAKFNDFLQNLGTTIRLMSKGIEADKVYAFSEFINSIKSFKDLENIDGDKILNTIKKLSKEPIDFNFQITANLETILKDLNEKELKLMEAQLLQLKTNGDKLDTLASIIRNVSRSTDPTYSNSPTYKLSYDNIATKNSFLHSINAQ